MVVVVAARLDRERDRDQGLDRLDRVLPDGGLARQHHRRGAVEHGVRDVRRLGARRLGALQHRLEHLRRRDHGLARSTAEPDDPLLHERHVGGADLDAEIAARDHQPVGGRDDRIELLDRLGLLDLRDHALAPAELGDHRAQVLDVLGAAHERERDVVGVLLDREREVLAIASR